MTFSATPCSETPRRIRTPSAQIFASAVGVRCPHTDGEVVLSRGDIEQSQCRDDRLFQPPHEPAHAQAVVVQSHDRIRDDLPGPVESDIPAAVGLDDLDAEHREHFTWRDQVLLSRDLGATTEGDDGRVLDEEKLFFSTGKNFSVCLLLSSPGVTVSEDPEIDHFHREQVYPGTPRELAPWVSIRA